MTGLHYSQARLTAKSQTIKQLFLTHNVWLIQEFHHLQFDSRNSEKSLHVRGKRKKNNNIECSQATQH